MGQHVKAGYSRDYYNNWTGDSRSTQILARADELNLRLRERGINVLFLILFSFKRKCIWLLEILKFDFRFCD